MDKFWLCLLHLRLCPTLSFKHALIVFLSVLLILPTLITSSVEMSSVLTRMLLLAARPSGPKRQKSRLPVQPYKSLRDHLRPLI